MAFFFSLGAVRHSASSSASSGVVGVALFMVLWLLTVLWLPEIAPADREKDYRVGSPFSVSGGLVVVYRATVADF